jgi:hypothetical protein
VAAPVRRIEGEHDGADLTRRAPACIGSRQKVQLRRPTETARSSRSAALLVIQTRASSRTSGERSPAFEAIIDGFARCRSSWTSWRAARSTNPPARGMSGRLRSVRTGNLRLGHRTGPRISPMISRHNSSPQGGLHRMRTLHLMRQLALGSAGLLPSSGSDA